LEIILEDSLVSGDHKVRFGWMELHSLNNSLGLSKRSLWIRFWQWMDNYLGRWLHILCHCSKV